MTRHDPAHAEAALRRALMVSAVVLVALAALVAVLYVRGTFGRVTRAEDITRVLVVAASQDDDGAVVAQIIVAVDLSQRPASAEPVSPSLGVTIPGTTYSTLADAYPFGGGAGVADALAQSEGEEALPYVALDPVELAMAIESAGGIEVDLPEEMSVFDGDDLYVLEAGVQTLDADELQAVLKGAPYLLQAQRSKLDVALAEGLTGVLAGAPDALAAADTDLDAAGIERVRAALAER